MTTQTTTFGSSIRSLMVKTVQSKNYHFDHEFSRVKNNEYYKDIVLKRINDLIFDIKQSIEKKASSSHGEVEIVNNMMVAFAAMDKEYSSLLTYKGMDDTSIITVFEHYSKTFEVDLLDVSIELKEWLNQNGISDIMVRFHTSTKSWQLPYNEYLIKL